MTDERSRAEAHLAALTAPQAARHGPGPRFGLDRIKAALAALGDPQDRIGTAIHVTGTNGKGSTTAFLRAIGEAAGLKVNVFTSPHLLSVHERIRVAGALVGDEALLDALLAVDRTGVDLTYFERLTVAAFLLFAGAQADMSVIEVGAGGATDATNVMRRPAATAFTAISRDHEAMFGVEGEVAIARLKAGVMRRGVPAVIGLQTPEVFDELRARVQSVGASASAEGVHWRCEAGEGGEGVVFTSARRVLKAPKLALAGAHQVANAGVALAVIEALGRADIDDDAMIAGLAHAAWPARLQRLAPGPFADAVGAPVIVDGAHNPAGAAALSDAIRAGNGPVGLVFSAQAAKDAAGMLGPLASAVSAVAVCPLPPSGGQEGGPGADPAQLIEIAMRFGLKTRFAATPLEAACALVERGAARVFVAGSLYLCGAVLRANGETVR
ncbi:bifunctional folylpolyglutamate synthase/dihydrofolate synthase [bacterium]|nr:bifunctional folylpolyglutamate synthase/dihydrofolate synthase [bacterium]